MAFHDRIERSFEAWGHACVRFRWPVTAGMLLLTLVMASGIADLRYESATDRFLDAHDPARLTYDRFRRQFSNDDTIVLLLRGEEIFTLPFLDRLRAIHRELEAEVPYVDEITSLVNARITRGIGDELHVDELLAEWPEDEAALGRIAALARSNPIYRNTLLSRDGHYTTLTLSFMPNGHQSGDEGLSGFDDLDAPAPSPDTRDLSLPPVLMNEDLRAVMLGIQGVVERHASEDQPIWITGNPEITYALTQLGRADVPRFVVLATLFICFFLVAFFRRVTGLVLPLVVVTLPLLATLGLMGAAGLPLTPTTQQLPSLLLAVCIGDSVHILAIFYRQYDAGASKGEAIAHALGHSGLAVAMTSLTTAVGFGSFYFADLKPLSELGLAAPAGVVLGLIYSVVLLPALLAWLPIRRRALVGRGPERLDRLLAGIGRFSSQRPWLVVGLSMMLVASSLVGASRLEIAHRPLEWFAPDHPTRIAAETTNTAMDGFMPLELVVDTGAPDGLHDPEIMRGIASIADFAKHLDINRIKVGQAISVSDIAKETHQALHGDDPAYYAISDDRALLAQELFLFESSGSDDLEDLVDSSFQQARISLLVTYTDGFLYLDLVRAILDEARRTLGEGARIEATGLVVLWLRTFEAMLSSTFRSYGIALLAITPMMLFLVGDVRLGLLSLIPNLAPIIMGMALMALLGIHFDMFTMMIGTIAIGIAVDDTIHFMHVFRRHYLELNDAPAAVQETLLSTGRALLITSLVLTSGFLVQLSGSMTGTRNVGLITGFTIMGALAADLVLSPALVTLAARFSSARRLRIARKLELRARA